MLSIIEPYMQKEPITVPNAYASAKNLLSLKSCLIAVKYSIFCTVEPTLTGVSGFS